MADGYDKDPNGAGGRVVRGTWLHTTCTLAGLIAFLAMIYGLAELAPIFRDKNLTDFF